MAFVKALAKSELQPGQGRCVKVNDKAIALFLIEGQYYAIDELCTHADASLADGPAYKDEKGRCVVECPWHGAQFDLKTGAAVTLPAVTPVKSYPVRVEGDAIEIDV
ncbi:MAG TPA: non-heme iron oxygenase ferredoxin subunit [Planctomycetota bacterium]|nr:non-heme iron oxygenase ferredoxin subunit [Planctomycetota bacterium]